MTAGNGGGNSHSPLPARKKAAAAVASPERSWSSKMMAGRSGSVARKRSSRERGRSLANPGGLRCLGVDPRSLELAGNGDFDPWLLWETEEKEEGDVERSRRPRVLISQSSIAVKAFYPITHARV
ncbi:hypothetical protein LXL04_017389 [Taraxacum kok-saghyz]